MALKNTAMKYSYERMKKGVRHMFEAAPFVPIGGSGDDGFTSKDAFDANDVLMVGRCHF